MNKVLIITYYWPPSGGAGVQRWLKFAKYLPEYGWEPVILTVDPEYAAYPAIDNMLGKDIPDSVKVHKTPATDWFSLYSSDKSRIPSAGFASNPGNNWKGKLSRFIRGNFFIPDPRRGWNSFAFKKACELIEKEKIVTFVTTSPPHSTQLIGLKLKKKYPGIKWIADLRDPWTDIYYYDQFYPTYFSRKIDKGYESSVLKKADRIISVGFLLKELFAGKLPDIRKKTEVISNGFDEADFSGIKHIEPSVFTITYVGTLSEKYPINGFLEAISELKKNSDLLLRFVGKYPENIKEKITSSATGITVEFIPYAPHSEAVSYMVNSSLLLLIIPEAGDNRLIITGKIYEYIASQRPILCLGPEDGEAAIILSKLKNGVCLGYSDSDKIADYINGIMKNPVNFNIDPSEYSRRNLTAKLASLL
ncbi:MAG: glycosyltransferase family 4 protein [Bacteroidetes bacterium]|nr:glycosyltransferase family 4 protein [Bacteroidota bacterium]